MQRIKRLTVFEARIGCALIMRFSRVVNPQTRQHIEGFLRFFPAQEPNLRHSFCTWSFLKIPQIFLE